MGKDCGARNETIGNWMERWMTSLYGTSLYILAVLQAVHAKSTVACRVDPLLCSMGQLRRREACTSMHLPVEEGGRCGRRQRGMEGENAPLAFYGDL